MLKISLKKTNIPIIVLEEKNNYRASFLNKKFPGKFIIICDFSIYELDNFARYKKNIRKVKGGYLYKNIMSIDHHAPMKEMQSNITSTKLAIEYVKSHKGLLENSVVIIHHYDCDSILSSSIIRGIIPPLQVFSEASEISDHLGNENIIADLLESLKSKKNIGYSLKNLNLLLSGKNIENSAKKLLNQRIDIRKKAKKIIKAGKFKKLGKIYYTEFENDMDLGMFLPFLPKAEYLLIGFKNKKDKYEVKIRLGSSAPKNIILNKIKYSKKDNFGFHGRWNAGGNRRMGGTTKSVKKVADILNKYIQEGLK